MFIFVNLFFVVANTFVVGMYVEEEKFETGFWFNFVAAVMNVAAVGLHLAAHK